jgi:membrane-anchored glycerophosphoryl diester phosphodiesterase (GDPDase)
MDLDLGKILSFAFFDWFKQKEVLKFVGIAFVIYAILIIVTNFVIYSSISPLINNFSLNGFTNSFFYIIGYVIVMSIISFVIFSAINYMLISKALEAKGRDYIDFDAKRWINFVFLNIAEGLAALFSVYKLRWLLILIAAIALFILGTIILIAASAINTPILVFAGVLMLLLGILLLFAYCFVIVYNCYRLIISSVIFVEGQESVLDALRLSWDKTHGSVLNVFVVMLILGVVVGIVSFVVAIPSSIYQGIGTMSGVANPSEMFNTLVDPVAIVLSMPTYLVASVMFAVQAFALVGVYDALDGKKPVVKEKTKTVARKKASKSVRRKK